ncbi:MAG: hypothetical protein ACSLFA_10770 [Mycobacterium sp.]
MADQSAVGAAHPPQLLLDIVNPALKLALKTPLGGFIGDFMLVAFTGRKSGKRYATPVSAHALDGALYVVLEAQWKYNFRDGADAQVSHRGKTSTMRGELITDPAAVADIADRIARSYNPKKAQRQMGLTFRDGSYPTVAQWEESARLLKIAAIKLT